MERGSGLGGRLWSALCCSASTRGRYWEIEASGRDGREVWKSRLAAKAFDAELRGLRALTQASPRWRSVDEGDGGALEEALGGCVAV